MTWIRALNGNVIDLPDDLAAILAAQGHELVDDKEPDPTPAASPRRRTK